MWCHSASGTLSPPRVGSNSFVCHASPIATKSHVVASVMKNELQLIVTHSIYICFHASSKFHTVEIVRIFQKHKNSSTETSESVLLTNDLFQGISSSKSQKKKISKWLVAIQIYITGISANTPNSPTEVKAIFSVVIKPLKITFDKVWKPSV